MDLLFDCFIFYHLFYCSYILSYFIFLCDLCHFLFSCVFFCLNNLMILILLLVFIIVAVVAAAAVYIEQTVEDTSREAISSLRQ